MTVLSKKKTRKVVGKCPGHYLLSSLVQSMWHSFHTCDVSGPRFSWLCVHPSKVCVVFMVHNLGYHVFVPATSKSVALHK